MHLFKFVKEKAKTKMHKYIYLKRCGLLKSKKVKVKYNILLPMLSNMLNTQSQELYIILSYYISTS